MRILCVFGEHNYGSPRRGIGYEYANFIPTFRQLGHEFLFLESWNRSRYPNFRKFNEKLLRTVEWTRPDVLFSVLFTYEIWVETLQILRDSGIVATVNWTTDDSWKYALCSRFVAPFFHASTTTYPAIYNRYKRDGISQVLLTQWAANAGRLRPPLPFAECQYPVTFVGTAHGKRRVWIEALRRRGIEVACFGHGWPNGPVAARDILEIIRKSVISLNFANSTLVWNKILPRRQNQIKARTFEVPGAGGFLVTEWAEGLEDCYEPGREIVVFRGLGDLAEKIRFYLAHPADRDAIAWGGYKRTCEDHTYDRRLAEVLDFALRERDKYFERRGLSPTGRIDWHTFREVAKRHKVDWKLQFLKRILVAACSLLWGPMRGPRAARRLVFELSWRLAGARTYSAAGWPGRMFYSAS